jgi:hypothetical protein
MDPVTHIVVATGANAGHAVNSPAVVIDPVL